MLLINPGRRLTIKYMPLLHIHASSKNINEKAIQEVHQTGAQILAEVLGKSTDYVMVLLNTGRSLSFAQDDQAPCAYLEVKISVGLHPKPQKNCHSVYVNW